MVASTVPQSISLDPAASSSESAPDESDDAIVLGVLDVVERNSAMTQRLVARELGIALGLANAYLKRCVRKGLIKISEAPARRYAYYLTPQGFAEKSRLTAAYLAHSFAFVRRARTQCSELFAIAETRGHRRVVLVGAGELAELANLVARDHRVEIVGIVDAGSEFKDRVAAFGSIDAALVTALESSREALAAALTVFDADRVYVPLMLRLSKPAVAADSEGGSR
jgi:DNA-binding MarR family transcriptional regulator